MSFNPNSAKPGHEVAFSQRKENVHSSLNTFNSVPIKHVQSDKHLGLTLGSSLSEVNKLTSVLPKSEIVLPWHYCLIDIINLLTKMKSFSAIHFYLIKKI